MLKALQQIKAVILFFLVTVSHQVVAQTGFLPSGLPGLKLWLAADSVSVNSAPFIDTCYDLSGNGNHAVQSNVALQPAVYSSQLNGHNIMRFDGTDDYLSFLQISTIRTVFWVLKEDTSALNNYTPLLGHSSLYHFHRGDNKALWRPFNTSPDILNGNTRINFTTVATPTLTTAPVEYSIMSLIATGNVSAESFTVDRSNFNRVWDGDLAELIIYDQALSQSDVQLVEDYLNDKYAPPVNLGPDIFVNYGFCDTILSAGNAFTEYLWSTGDTTPTISVNTSGTYWLQAKNIFGRLSLDSVLVSFPPVNYPSDTVICAGIPTQWSTGFDHSGYNFQWQDLSADSALSIIQPGQYFVTISDTLGCSLSSDTIVFSADSFALQATLGPDTLFCGEGYLFLNNGNAQSYSWSDSSTNDTLLVTASGQYWLTASSSNGCTKTDSISLTINPVPFFTLGNDTTICFNDNFELNPDVSNSLNFLWSDGSVDSLLQVNSGSGYWLQLTNSFGCDFTDTIVVVVDSTLIPYSPGPDTSFCSGNFILVSGAGAPGPLTYLWSDASVNDSLQIFNSGTYWVEVTNANNCKITDSIVVSVSGIAPTANFSADTSCLGNINSFTDLSNPPAGNTLVSWQWSFGDGFTSVLQNPQHTYLDTGLIMASLIVTTDSGCTGSVSKPVRIYPKPAAGFTVNNLCENSPVLFNDTSVAFGYPLTSWEWNFNDPSSGNNSSFLQAPQHIFTNAGTFTVQLIATGIHGCSDTVSEAIVIKPSPVSGFNVSLACSNEPVVFTDTSSLPSSTVIASSYWDFGDVSAASTINAAHTYSVSGSFSVVHVITASNGCQDSLIYSLTVHPDPVADFGYSPPCANDSVQFTDNSSIQGGSIISYSWNFNNTQTSALQNPSVKFNSAGNKMVYLAVTSDQGCVSADSAQIAVSAAPVAGFFFSPLYGNPPLTVTFTNNSVGAVSSGWDFGDSSQSTMSEPTHVYTDTGAFIITLNVYNNAGCNDSITDTIFISAPRLDVAVIGLTLSGQNNFVDVTALLQNKGTIDVSSMELYVRLNNGTYVKENWTGSLNKGAVIPYHFISQFLAAGETNFICAMVKNPNGTTDEVPENDEQCSSLDSSRLVIYPPFPNPSTDMVTLGVNIPRTSSFKAVVYDSRGRELMVAFDGELEKGMRFINVNTSSFETGIYLVKIEYQGKVNPVKFMKRNP